MFKKITMLFLVALMTFGSVEITCFAASSYETYTYSYEGKPQISPDAYLPLDKITDFGLEEPLNKPKEMVYDSKNKRIFIADTGNNRIVVLNLDLKVIHTIKDYKNIQGEVIPFNQPQGIFIKNDGAIYVADTANANIVEFDSNYTQKRVILPPDSSLLPSDFKYNPRAVCVDNSGRIYVISQNSNMGVISLDKFGAFQGFIGAQRVSPNVGELMMRTFMSEEQINRSARFVPMEYSNLTLDEKGFIYVTSGQIKRFDLWSYVWSRSGSSTFSPIKKINPAGTDVLKRNGFFPPVGDIMFDAYDDVKKEKKIDPSQFSEICLQKNGIYSLVDEAGNKIFTYDSSGNLLYAFGGKGDSIGLYNQITAIAEINNEMLVLDSQDGSITKLEKTLYGTQIDTVIMHQENREFDKVRSLWQEILNENNNFDMAYLGIGKSYLEDGNYDEALQYFKLINNKTYYSRTLKFQRQEFLESYGLFILLGIAALIVLIVMFFGFAKKYNNKKRFKKSSGKLSEQLMFAFYTMFHPFNGFYELKHEKRGSIKSATVLLAIASASYLLKDFASCFLLKSVEDKPTIISSLSNILLPLILWCIANWCLTSLMDGKGKFKDIYIASCYCLIPITMFTFITTIIGHFMILEEFNLLSFAVAIGVGWTLLLIFFSSSVVHEYTVGKNILVTLASIVVICIILFLLMIFFSLFGRIVSLIISVINEIAFRS